MAKTLLEGLKELQQRRDAGLSPKPQQQQIVRQMAAGTGKAGQTTGPASSLGEQSAIQAGQQAIQQQQVAGAVAGEQLGQQQEQLQQQKATAEQQLAGQQQVFETQQATQLTGTREDLAAKQSDSAKRLAARESANRWAMVAAYGNKLRELSSARGVAADDIFFSFARENKDLAFRSDAAEIEQLAFLLSMQNKAYVDEINRIGYERNLKDQQAYEEQASNVVWGDKMASLVDELNWRGLQRADERVQERELAKIDVDMALQIAAASIAADNQRAVIEGGTEAVKGGASAYAAYSKPASTKTGPVAGPTQSKIDTTPGSYTYGMPKANQ